MPGAERRAGVSDQLDSVLYHPSLPFSRGEGREQVSCIFSCPVKAGVLDLETGPQAGLGAFNDFFVETRDAGLCPAAGEILISGVRPDPNVDGFVQFSKGGERRIVEKTLESCGSFIRDGLLVGHNLLGFDLPFLSVRAGVHGLAIPSWLSGSDRILDTYRMFNTSFSKFSTGMLSLQETAALWGREPDTDSGASFGELWRGGTEGQRDSLRHYNMLNLIDSLCLAVHSGVLGQPSSATSIPTLEFGWEGTEEFEYELPAPPATRKNAPFFHWITAPVKGLFQNGPRRKAGWGKTIEDSVKKDYPRGTGRLDAGACMIVGFLSSSRSLLHLEGESQAIEGGLTELRRMNGEGITPYTENPAVFKNYTCLRISTHGGVLPPWFSRYATLKDDRLRRLGDGGLDAVALGLGLSDIRIPSFCGQDHGAFLDVASTIATHRANKAAFFEERDPGNDQ